MEEKIKEMEAQIAELRGEIKRERKKAEAYNMGLETGVQVAALKAGLMDGGLDENFADKLILSTINSFGGMRR